MKCIAKIKSLFTKKQVVLNVPPVVEPQPEPLPKPVWPSLSWERYPENRPWTEYLFELVYTTYFDVLDKAQDWPRIYPQYKNLTRAKRLHVMCELISTMSYYESAWNQASQSVDVGKATDRDTWSVGLMQMSVTDQPGVFTGKGPYKFEDLITAKPNLHLALAVLARQVNRTGLIILPNKHPQRYWAVLLDGNKYSKVEQIIAKVQERVK